MSRPGVHASKLQTSKVASIGVAAVAALATVAVIAWGTRPLGPGLYGDGVGYLSAAQSLVQSGHLRVAGAPYWSSDSLTPMRQWPPGFAVAIAVPLRTGLSLMSAVAVVQMVAGALIAALTVLMVARVSSLKWAVLAVIAVLLTPALLGTELNVVSEPLYVACLALLWAAMTWRPERPLLSGVAAAAMVMIRYLGVSAVVAAGLWAFVQPATPAQRIRRSVMAVAPGIAAYAAWSFAVRHSGGTVTTGAVDHQLGPIIRSFVGSVGAWLAPWNEGPSSFRVAAKLWIVLVAASASFLALGSRGRSKMNTVPAPTDGSSGATSGRFILAGAVLAICHLAVLFAARVATASVDFSARTFSPVHYLFTVMALVALGMAWSTSQGAGTLALAAGVVWFAGLIAASGNVLHEARSIGLDHASVEERSSPTIAWLRTRAAAIPIYTNEPAKIYFHLHRTARSLPWIVTADTLRHLSDVLSQRPGYVVWFAGGQPSAYVPRPLLERAISLEKLKLGARLSGVAHLSDGDIMVQDTAMSKNASCCLIQTAGSPP
jgi:hypothetical protein